MFSDGLGWTTPPKDYAPQVENQCPKSYSLPKQCYRLVTKCSYQACRGFQMQTVTHSKSEVRFSVLSLCQSTAAVSCDQSLPEEELLPASTLILRWYFHVLIALLKSPRTSLVPTAGPLVLGKGKGQGLSRPAALLFFQWLGLVSFRSCLLCVSMLARIQLFEFLPSARNWTDVHEVNSRTEPLLSLFG